MTLDHATFVSFLLSVDAGYQSGHSSWVVNGQKANMQSYLAQNMAYLGPINQDFLWSFFVSMRVIGIVLGAEIGGWAMDKYGRRLTLRWNALVGALTCFMQWLPGLVPNVPLWWFLFIGRFFQSIAVGLGQTNTVAFISEISRTEARGSNTAKYNLCSAGGAMFTVIFSLPQLLGTSQTWYWTNFIPFILSFAVFIGSWLIPESPRYLVSKKEMPEAMKSTAYYHSSGIEDAARYVIESRKNIYRERYYAGQGRYAAQTAKQAWWQKGSLELFSRSNLRVPLTLLFCLAAGRSLSGYNIIFSYSTFALKNAGVPDYAATWGTVATVTIRFLASLCMGLVIERSGRRKPIIASSVAMFVCFAVLCVTTVLQTDKSAPVTSPNITMNQTDFTIEGYFALAATCLWPIAYVLGVGCISRIVVTEIFGQEDRSQATKLFVQLDSILSLVYTFAYLPLFRVIDGWVYLLILVPLLPLIAFIWLKMPETKGIEIRTVLQNMTMAKRMRQAFFRTDDEMSSIAYDWDPNWQQETTPLIVDGAKIYGGPQL